MKKGLKRFFSSALLILLTINICCVNSFAEIDYMVEAESRKKLPIESNSIENWPLGPEIGAESAILLEANTGTILYSKNIHEKLYPASVTKLLTALVAYDNCKMDDMVTFSYEAVGSIDWRTDANMGINGGSSITMEQTLYGMLVGSANEAAYAIAEHVSGNGKLDEFAKLMNEKAASLGCVDSNFVTPNGIHDENHYTSTYDLSLIAKAFFDNDFLSQISCTPSYKIPQSSTQPKGELAVYAKSKLFPGKEYAYEDLVGTKTGYTEYARQTLVSCAERGNIKLICVIMKEEAPYQYTDTIDLFNYGFNNFQMVSIADKDEKYNVSSANSYSSEGDLFGNSSTFMNIDPKAVIILPFGAAIDSADSTVSYDNLDAESIARIDYSFGGIPVGYANILPNFESQNKYEFTDAFVNEPETEDVVFIDVIKLVFIIFVIVVVLILAFILFGFLHNKIKYRRRSTNKKYNFKNKKLDWKKFK